MEDDVLQQNRNIVAHGIGAVVAVAVVAGIDDDLELFENVNHHVLVGVLKDFVRVNNAPLGVVVHQQIDNAVDFFVHTVCHNITSSKRMRIAFYILSHPAKDCQPHSELTDISI